MLVDILASNNTININIKAVQLFGLHPAVYLSFLFNHYNKAKDAQNRIDEDGYFIVNRDNILKKSTLTKEEQYEIDNKLSKLNIINISDKSKDKVKIDFKNLISLLTSENLEEIENVKKISLSSEEITMGKLTQRQKEAIGLKRLISYPNEELEQAYRNWVDGVYANPKGFLSKRAINVFIQSVDNYAQGDLDLALKIIDIATINGLRDCQWAINTFEKDYKKEFYKERKQRIVQDQPQERPNKIVGDIKF